MRDEEVPSEVILRVGDIMSTWVPNKGVFFREVIAIEDATNNAIFSDGSIGRREFEDHWQGEYYEWRLQR